MKLLSCHIYNFGTFSDYDIAFEDGLNVIMQPNGWGKSTLAAFVKAMLYGFDGKRIHDLVENERLRYSPWQGGKYGGWLDFEVDGKEYRAYRVFGKSKATDMFKLVDIASGENVSSLVTDDLGEWVFGLDSGAFQKSIYVTQNGFGLAASSDGIRSRLNLLFNETESVADLSDAQKALDERRKFYKKIGKRGEIFELTEEMTRDIDARNRAKHELGQVEQLEKEIAENDKKLVELDEHIARAKQASSSVISAREQGRALLDARAKLVQKCDEANAALEQVRADCSGALPSDQNIDAAKQASLDLIHARKEINQLQPSIEEDARQLQALAGNGATLPDAEELQKRRAQVSGYHARKRALDKGGVECDSTYEGVANAIANNPRLFDEIQDLESEVASIRAQQTHAKEVDSKLAFEESTWKQRRADIVRLSQDAADKSAGLGTDEDVFRLREDAKRVRDFGERSIRAEAKLQSAKAELHSAQKEEGVSNQESLKAAFDGLLPAGDLAREARESFSSACAARDSARCRVAEARSAFEEAVEAERDAKAADEAAKARLEQDAREAADAADVAARSSKTTKIAGLACLVLAVVAIIAAVIGVVSIIVGGVVGAIFVAAAILAFVRAGKIVSPAAVSDALGQQEGDSPEVVSSTRQRISAEGNLQEAEHELERLEKKVVACQHDVEDADALLSGLLEGAFPGRIFDFATINDQIPVLLERIKGAMGLCDASVEAQARVDDCANELREIETEFDSIRGLYPDLKGASREFAEKLEERASSLASRRQDALLVQSSLQDAIAIAADVDKDTVNQDYVERFLAQLDTYTPEGIAELERESREYRLAAEACESNLNRLLEACGLPTIAGNDVAVGLERLQAAIESYKRQDNLLFEAMASSAGERAELEKIALDLETWACNQGVRGLSDLSEEWFSSQMSKAKEAQQIAWQLKQNRANAEKIQETIERRSNEATEFLASFEWPGAELQGKEDIASLVGSACEWVEAVRSRENALDAAKSELISWQEENAPAMKACRDTIAQGENSKVDDALAQLNKQRDAIVKDRARCEDQRSAILRDLEAFPAIEQRIAHIAQVRQKAQANLFTIQCTSEFLDKARRNLDDRYLGDLVERFDNYARTWLDDDSLQTHVDSDFAVAVGEGDALHEVEGLSKGYRDLFDVCFRMALIDTMFQTSVPFIIMDDPFANLDQIKLGKALGLLDVLARGHQIIYFSCHPSRIKHSADSLSLGGGEEAAAFVLPKQTKKRELPRERARREAEERARAQAELVASYHVVPVSANKSSLRCTELGKPITGNLFQLSFEADASTGTKDAAFEMYFIDEKGRALCDRQVVEIQEGAAVPARLRFDLCTYDDSGNHYDLVVHEEGRAPEELAARIPFKAEIAFNNSLFDM